MPSEMSTQTAFRQTVENMARWEFVAAGCPRPSNITVNLHQPQDTMRWKVRIELNFGSETTLASETTMRDIETEAHKHYQEIAFTIRQMIATFKSDPDKYTRATPRFLMGAQAALGAAVDQFKRELARRCQGDHFDVTTRPMAGQKVELNVRTDDIDGRGRPEFRFQITAERIELARVDQRSMGAFMEDLEPNIQYIAEYIGNLHQQKAVADEQNRQAIVPRFIQQRIRPDQFTTQLDSNWARGYEAHVDEELRHTGSQARQQAAESERANSAYRDSLNEESYRQQRVMPIIRQIHDHIHSDICRYFAALPEDVAVTSHHENHTQFFEILIRRIDARDRVLVPDEMLEPSRERERARILEMAIRDVAGRLRMQATRGEPRVSWSELNSQFSWDPARYFSYTGLGYSMSPPDPSPSPPEPSVPVKPSVRRKLVFPKKEETKP